MGKPLNDRQRRFCELLVQGSSATQAYTGAGFSENGAAQSAERLLRNAEVRAYVAELRSKATAEVTLTLAEHLRRLDELARAAERDQQFAAAITAETNRGKASGFYIERHAVDDTLGSLFAKAFKR